MGKIIIESVETRALDSNPIMFQTGFWGVFKSLYGWKADNLRIRFGSKAFNLLLLSRVAGSIFRFGYVPFGPPLVNENKESVPLERFLKLITEGIVNHTGESFSFIRYDLPWGRMEIENGFNKNRDGEVFPGLYEIAENRLKVESSIRKSPVDIQPPSTVILSIDKNNDKLFQSMKPKTRYNIRLSFKRGVRVFQGQISDISTWYAMYKETAKRDRITIHSRSYYEDLFRLSMEYGEGSPEIRLYLAEVKGEIVAGNIVAMKEKMSWYLYGASSNRYRNLMPTYALQWYAIEQAREAGCIYYDLFGIPPSGDPEHPMSGLYRFKTGFGGTIFHRYGCYDVVLNRNTYSLYRIAEKFRNDYYKKFFKKKIFNKIFFKN